MSAPFRFGLIGGGRMGRTHLRGLADSTDVEIVAVTEPVEAAAASLREQGLAVFPSAEEMFAESPLDGVLIAVPTPQHIDTTRKALEAGLPVLCEKPFGLVADDARAAGRFAAEKGLALQIAYWRRFVPQLTALRKDLAEGAYGTVHFLVCSQWDEAPPPLSFRNDSGGIYIDMGVHEIDQTLWLLGQDVTEFTTQSFPTIEDSGVENDPDSTQALVMLSGGTSAVISLGRFYKGGDIVSVALFGSRDHTRFDVVSPELGEEPQLQALKLQAEAFARHARGSAQEGTTSEEAARVLELAHDLTARAGVAVLGATS
ncbi:gfo/Idh/MocA family oxidoreductase [Mycolicibacterium moriokaense]|nr:gfo/Idh/MocA family oxidoreductase [Mycolicibacterium moriokaense]